MTKDDIRQKMEAYRCRIEETRQKEAEQAQKKSQSVAQFQQVVKETIRPTMEKFSEEMRSSICRFRIDGDTAAQEGPHLRYWITPVGVSLNEYDFKDVPHVFYEMNPQTGEVKTNISTVIKGKAGRVYQGRAYQLEEIKPETVERDLTEALGELMENLLATHPN